MKFGGDITIKRTTNSSYNSDDGSVLKNTTSVTVKGNLESISKTEVNDLISQDDKKLLVSGQELTFTPTTKDKILISSIEYKIIQIDIDSAENLDVLYTFYLRS